MNKDATVCEVCFERPYRLKTFASLQDVSCAGDRQIESHHIRLRTATGEHKIDVQVRQMV